VKIVKHRGVLATFFNAQLPFLAVVLPDRRQFGGIEQRIVKRRMLADDAALGKANRPACFYDQAEIVRGGIDKAVVGAFGDENIIPRFKRQYAKIALKAPLALVHKVQFVAVGIAEKERHAVPAA